jgi:membrane-associated phospholipid phosphatase
MVRKEIIQDISSLGGNPAYILVGAIFFFLGQAKVASHLLVVIALCYLVTTGFRLAFFRERPEKQKYRTILQRIDASSFPSLHAMRAAALVFIVALFFNHWLMWLFAFMASAAVAYSRVWLKRHHPTDVIVGTGIGFAIACVSLAFPDFSGIILDIYHATFFWS